MSIKDKNLYYVGGIVRDEFLGTKSLDIDYCYEGDAINFARNLNIIKTNPDFGTVRVLHDDREIDIASTRKEKYPKAGHLPLVDEIGCTLEEDLRRRDFTINAMARNTLTGELYDPFNGLQDLKDKKLRILHENSFIEDPTRIIRGLKFAVRFGFQIEEKTLHLQNEYLNNINYDMSYHRLKKELKETFNLNKLDAYNAFIKQNIYKLLSKNQTGQTINPKIEVLINKYKPSAPWLIYLAQFDLSNLELNAQERDILKQFEIIKKFEFNSDIEIYNTFKNLHLESIILYALYTDEETATKYLDTFSKIKINITGKDLQNLGIPQGKIYNTIFEEILKEKLKNQDLSKEEELNIAKNMGIRL